MSESSETKNKRRKFIADLPGDFDFPKDKTGKRLLAEYGALFAAAGGAVPPKTVIFKNEAEVSEFQSGLKKSKIIIGGFKLELQAAAVNALQKAIVEAAGKSLTITPRGADAAKRTYSDTIDLWASRVNPALAHWTREGKLKETEAAKIFNLSPFEQVPEIFRLESKGMFCSRDLSKSIIYSVAPPGTSQHLSMLALDINEHNDKNVRDVLANHFWFQTVVSDLPHFTFLGVPENRLPDLGLKQISSGGRIFWLPDL